MQNAPHSACYRVLPLHLTSQTRRIFCIVCYEKILVFILKIAIFPKSKYRKGLFHRVKEFFFETHDQRLPIFEVTETPRLLAKACPENFYFDKDTCEQYDCLVLEKMFSSGQGIIQFNSRSWSEIAVFLRNLKRQEYLQLFSYAKICILKVILRLPRKNVKTSRYPWDQGDFKITQTVKEVRPVFVVSKTKRFSAMVFPREKLVIQI